MRWRRRLILQIRERGEYPDRVIPPRKDRTRDAR